MSERHDITFLEVEGPTPNPPDLLKELRDLILEIFPDATESGARWLRGKGDQEIAKAAEIRASAIEKLGRLALEREKLLQERDAALLKDRADQVHEANNHRQRMYELKTQRLKEVTEALKALKDTGTHLTARTRTQIAELIVGALSEGDVPASSAHDL